MLTEPTMEKLPQDYVGALLASGAHREIVKHRNFNPRIIEWMTTVLSELRSASEYGKEFLSNLEHPHRLWEHAYSRQLSAPAQILLLVFGTLSSEVLLDDADRAFSAVWSAAQRDPLLNVGGAPFVGALRELDGTFIKSQKQQGGQIVLAFQSPSIRDFVEYKLRLEGGIARSILERAVFFEQLRHLDKVMLTSPIMKGEFAVEWAESLGRASVRTVDLPDCVLWRVRRSNGSTYLSRAGYSTESRTAFAIEALKAAPPEVVRPHAEQLALALESGWRAGRISAEAVEGILGAIRDTPHLVPERKQVLAARCAAALVGADAAIEKYKVFGELTTSGLLPTPGEQKTEEVRDEFLKSLEWLLDVSEMDDYSNALDAIAEVEAAAKLLGLDITAEVDLARKRATNIHEPDYPDVDDEPPPRAVEAGSEALSDADIDDIFSGLEKQ